MDSNNNQFLVNTVLPGVISLATGLYVYTLTSEELISEENRSKNPTFYDWAIHPWFESPLLTGEEPEKNQENEEQEDQELILPSWAKESLEKIQTLENEIIKLNYRLTQHQASTKQENKLITTNPKEQFIYFILESIYKVVVQLDNDCHLDLKAVISIPESQIFPDALSSEIISGLETTQMIITNLLQNKSTPRYHKLSSSNAHFKESLFILKSHQSLLNSFGFYLNGNYYIWKWAIIAEENIAIEDNKGYPIPSSEDIESILQFGIQAIELAKTDLKQFRALLCEQIPNL